jgi:hypothetical protein
VADRLKAFIRLGFHSKINIKNIGWTTFEKKSKNAIQKRHGIKESAVFENKHQSAENIFSTIVLAELK